MGGNEDTPAMKALKRKVAKLTDPAKVELYKIDTQTSRTNGRLLHDWAKDMRYHETKTPRPYECVYLVVSDLKLLLASRQKVQKTFDEKARGIRHSNVFLNSKDIDSLHEKHWAIEVDGRYYELVRDEDDRSHFSARNRVGHFDRRVAARIFIGTTHYEHHALTSIGKSVIATQGRYELTRNNCHRFVRVFAYLMLCRNHSKHTLTELPFGVEEHIASRAAGSARNSKQRHMRSIVQNIGVGVGWTAVVNDLQVELRRTVRNLEQHTTSNGGNDDTLTTTYYNKFTSKQEQTSYISELDPNFLPQIHACQPVTENPYVRILRFEKVSHFRIVPSAGDMQYKIDYVQHGMISGPHGNIQSEEGFPQHAQPVEIIRDKSHVLRDGNGKRLEWPETQWRSILANIHDAIVYPPTRASYNHRTRTTDLLKSAGPLKNHPYLVDIIKWGSIALVARTLLMLRHQRKDSDSENGNNHARNQDPSMLNKFIHL